MKDKVLTIKVTEPFKERLRTGADHFSIKMSQYVIQAINEKLQRDGIK